MAGLNQTQEYPVPLLHDPLTGFWNEEGFVKKLTELIKKRCSNLCLIGIKLNTILNIQKTYGQEISKYYIKAFSRKIKIMFKNDLLRAYIRPNIFLNIIKIRKEELKAFLENTKSFLSTPIPFKGGLLPTHIFLTCCTIDRNSANAKGILDTVLKVLFEGKKSIFDLNREWKTIKKNLPTYLNFTKKIIMGEIGFALQPVKDGNNKIVFYEALARMPKEESTEILAAQKFLSVAQKLSLKGDIERTILYKVIFFLKQYPKIKHISINISPDYLFGDFERDLKYFLQELKVKPERIWFEITEQSEKSIADFNFKEKLIKLRNKGFKIILDDFGQFHSNINILKEFNWDIVKIDGNFIKNILENKFDLMFIKFLVELAKNKKFKLVAEFVENEEIASKLREIGVHLLQGYYCGRPSFIPLSQKIIPPLIFLR